MKLYQKKELESISNHYLVFVKELPSIYQRAIIIINSAQKCASLSTKREAVKKQMHICFNKSRPIRTKWIQSILKTMFEFMFT